MTVDAMKDHARRSKRFHFEATDDDGSGLGYCLRCMVTRGRKVPYPCLEVQIADAVLTDR